MAYENRISFDVRYSETDRMGIVHHSRYYPWFEMGRCAFMDHTGISYAEMEKRDLQVPLTQSGAKYFEGAKFGDTVTVATKLSELGVVRCTFKYRVYRSSDQKLLAEGFTKHAFVDGNLKPINAKKKFPEIWQSLKELLDDQDS